MDAGGMHSAQQFAKIAGVTLKMLRHYERRGLLSPHRTDAGHRRYGYRDLQQLERILSLRAMGLSLADIATGMHADAAARTSLLEQHRVTLEERRARLTRAIDAIDFI